MGSNRVGCGTGHFVSTEKPGEPLARTPKYPTADPPRRIGSPGVQDQKLAISTLDFGRAGLWTNYGTGLVVSPRKARRMRGWKEVGRRVGTRAIESKVQSLRSKVEDQMSAIMTLEFVRGLWTDDGTGHVSARREGDDWTAVGRWGTGSPAGADLYVQGIPAGNIWREHIAGKTSVPIDRQAATVKTVWRVLKEIERATLDRRCWRRAAIRQGSVLVAPTATALTRELWEAFCRYCDADGLRRSRYKLPAFIRAAVPTAKTHHASHHGDGSKIGSSSQALTPIPRLTEPATCRLFLCHLANCRICRLTSPGMKLDPRRWWGSVFTKGKEDPRQGQTRSWPGPDTRQILAILSS